MFRILCGGKEKSRVTKLNCAIKHRGVGADNQLCSWDSEHYRARRIRSARKLIGPRFNLSARHLSPTVHVLTGRLKKSWGANNVKEKPGSGPQESNEPDVERTMRKHFFNDTFPAARPRP